MSHTLCGSLAEVMLGPKGKVLRMLVGQSMGTLVMNAHLASEPTPHHWAILV